MKMAKVGVLVEKFEAERRWKYGVNVFGVYIHEILTDAGIPYRKFSSVNDAVNSSLDILIVALEADDEDSTAELWSFANSGGSIISYAGLSKFLVKLGCAASRTTGPGYADLSEYIKDEVKLRFLSSAPWAVREEANEYLEARSGYLFKDQPTGVKVGSALMRFKVGSGTVERWSVNIVETIVGFQQGTSPVFKDGIPSSDGMGAVDEGILKTDDACSLDWEWDRAVTETGQPYFHTPYADIWREVLISHLIETAVNKGLILPFVDFWPEGVQSVAMISHDSDYNIDDSAEITLELLKRAGIQTTWCMMEPGFSPHFYEKIEEAGHELAFHYNAVKKDNGFWQKEEFSRQMQWLRSAIGKNEITSNKNHFTRYEGWGEQFDWCESEGIASDQSFGPSKKGNIGFIFGTCRPFFPIAWANQKNRTYNVTEICYQTPDIDINSWADSSIIEPSLKTIKRVGGTAHIVCHQYHLFTKKSSVDAMYRFIDAAKSHGFVFWTGKQINDWVRARRSAEIEGIDEQGSLVFKQGIAVPEGLSAWVPSVPGSEDADAVSEQRYGMLCRKVLVDRRARHVNG